MSQLQLYMSDIIKYLCFIQTFKVCQVKINKSGLNADKKLPLFKILRTHIMKKKIDWVTTTTNVKQLLNANTVRKMQFNLYINNQYQSLT